MTRNESGFKMPTPSAQRSGRTWTGHRLGGKGPGEPAFSPRKEYAGARWIATRLVCRHARHCVLCAPCRSTEMRRPRPRDSNSVPRAGLARSGKGLACARDRAQLALDRLAELRLIDQRADSFSRIYRIRGSRRLVDALKRPNKRVSQLEQVVEL